MTKMRVSDKSHQSMNVGLTHEIILLPELQVPTNNGVAAVGESTGKVTSPRENLNKSQRRQGFGDDIPTSQSLLPDGDSHELSWGLSSGGMDFGRLGERLPDCCSALRREAR